MNSQQWIFTIVDDFYQHARVDVLIGYHFRNIPDFDQHIPRIAAFWELQLLGSTTRELDKPFDVVNLHLPLGIKRGELGRWLVLFRKSLSAHLEKNPEFSEMGKVWESRLQFFEGVFSRFLGL